MKVKYRIDYMKSVWDFTEKREYIEADSEHEAKKEALKRMKSQGFKYYEILTVK